MNASQLKGLQTRINQCRLEIKGLEADKRKLKEDEMNIKTGLRDLIAQINVKDRSINLALKEIKNIESRIEKNTNVKMIISEHAMLRFIEREIGIDMEELQERILPSKNMKAISKLGDGEFPIGNHKVRVRNNTVVTVVLKK